MVLRVKEVRYRYSKIDRTRSEEVMIEQLLPIHEGYLDFVGTRDKYPYSDLIFVKDIKEDEITLIMLNKNERLRELIHLKLNNEEIFYHKGPRGIPYGYNYHLTLEDDIYEK